VANLQAKIARGGEREFGGRMTGEPLCTAYSLVKSLRKLVRRGEENRKTESQTSTRVHAGSLEKGSGVRILKWGGK